MEIITDAEKTFQVSSHEYTRISENNTRETVIFGIKKLNQKVSEFT